MNKSNLIKIILNKNKKYKFSEIEKIVDLFFKEITNALTNQRRIELRGFGSFFTKIRDKRIGLILKMVKKLKLIKKYIQSLKWGKFYLKK